MNPKIKLVLISLILNFFLLQTISSSALYAKEPVKSQSSWLTYKGTADRTGVAPKLTSEVPLPLKVAWKHTVEGKSNGFVDWGPVAANGIVYTGDGLNNILALNSATGEIVWQKKIISNIFSVSLSEDTKILYVTTAITTKATPTLFALDPSTGEDLWDNMVNGQEAVGGMEGAPAIADGKIFTAYLQYEGHGGVAAYDGTTGKMFWHWQMKRFSPYTSLTYADGRVYVGFEHKALYCFDATEGKVLWIKQDLSDIPYASPTAVNDKIYIGVGSTLFSLSAKSGDILWQQPLEGQVGHSSVSSDGKFLYVGTQESKVFSLNLDNGKIVWKAELQKGSIESSPVLDTAHQTLIIATQENFLLALDMKNGSVKSQLKLSEDPRGVWKSAPAFYGGKIYVGSLDRSFYAVE